MEILNFVAALVDSLAWPAALVTVLVLFRRPLRALLPNLNRLRYKGLEVEFGQELAAVRQQIKPATDAKKLQADQEAADYYRAVGETSPRTAIIEAWIGMETSAISSVRTLDLIPPDGAVPFPKLLTALRHGELLSERGAQALGRLRNLRNAAAHDPDLEIGEEAVDEFIELTRSIGEKIAGRAWERMPKIQ